MAHPHLTQKIEWAKRSPISKSFKKLLGDDDAESLEGFESPCKIQGKPMKRRQHPDASPATKIMEPSMKKEFISSKGRAVELFPNFKPSPSRSSENAKSNGKMKSMLQDLLGLMEYSESDQHHAETASVDSFHSSSNHSQQSVLQRFGFGTSIQAKEDISHSSFELDFELSQASQEFQEKLVLTSSTIRPSVTKKSEEIYFQIFHIDTPPSHVENGKTVIRLYGSTSDGQSVCLTIKNVRLCFYISNPGWGQDQIVKLMQYLNRKVHKYGRLPGWKTVLGRNIDGVSFKDSQFIKVLCSSHSVLKKAVAILTGESYKFNIAESLGLSNQQQRHLKIETFESEVDPCMQFLIRHNLSGASWIHLKPDTFSYYQSNQKIKSQIQVDSLEKAITNADSYFGEQVAPILVCSFELEIATFDGKFPSAADTDNEIVQIAMSFEFQCCQASSTQSRVNVSPKYLVCSVPVQEIEGWEIILVENESFLLEKWRELVILHDPDILCGFDLINRDFPYMFQRAKLYGFSNFECFGRISEEECSFWPNFSVESDENTQKTYLEVSGRLVLDFCSYVKKNFKLSDYSLSAITYHFLKEQSHFIDLTGRATIYSSKDQNGYSMISKECTRNADMILNLMNHSETTLSLVQMARVSGAHMKQLLCRGQQYKVFSQIYKYSKTSIPQYYVPDRQTLNNHDFEGHSDESKANYEGATVIDAKRGFYANGIATLDFASLYPSIIIAYNLSYETRLSKKDDDLKFKLKADIDFLEISGSRFLITDGESHMGLLPKILVDLLKARKDVKAQLKLTEDPLQKSILNCKQLAIKIFCNSVYGFCGASTSPIPCVEIASTVTFIGRELISNSKNLIERTHFPGAEVIYGDTDSVMVDFHVEGTANDNELLTRVNELSLKAADLLNATFPRPIELEFEKIYFPYILLSKKRYAGNIVSEDGIVQSIDIKGLEAVRRDSCLFVRETMHECIRIILEEHSPQRSFAFLEHAINRLKSGQVPINELVITREYSKSKYKSKPPHVEVCRKRQLRDPNDIVKIGDRIPFVILKTDENGNAPEKSSNIKIADRAEDPLFAIKEGLELDLKYYLSNQLQNAMTNLFSVFGPVRKDVFSSIRLKSNEIKFKKSSKSSLQKNALGFSVQTILHCPGCNCVIPRGTISQNQPAICRDCRPKSRTIIGNLSNVYQNAVNDSRLSWNVCGGCVRRTHSNASPNECVSIAKQCGNDGCAKLYKRHQCDETVKDIESLLEDLHLKSIIDRKD